jgi:glutathione peroxidase-family protein
MHKSLLTFFFLAGLTIMTFAASLHDFTLTGIDSKTMVKGKDAHPVYVWAAGEAGMLGTPKWNFHKYLFGRDGKFIDWFSTPTEPQSAKISAAVEKALAE